MELLVDKNRRSWVFAALAYQTAVLQMRSRPAEGCPIDRLREQEEGADRRLFCSMVAQGTQGRVAFAIGLERRGGESPFGGCCRGPIGQLGVWGVACLKASVVGLVS